MVINMKVLMSLMFAVVVAHARRPKTATPKPGVPAWQRARGGPFAGAASESCSPSCALDVGCPQNFELTNSGDASWLIFSASTQLYVWCDEGGNPAPVPPNLSGYFGVCVDGAWVWKERVGRTVTLADRPSCLIESADCCQVRTSCPFDFSFVEPDRGLISWRNTKDAESDLYIYSRLDGSSGARFGGPPNWQGRCIDGTWEDDVQTLDAYIPESFNVAYTSA